ncbi:putative transcription factor B3-Domain family [Helianthus debilis subsp. tardiflorus]
MPYDQPVKMCDGDRLWVVRVKKNVFSPVFGDGLINVVRDCVLKKNDYVLFKAIRPNTFVLSWFKECVYENSFITTQIRPHDYFYEKHFKGGTSTLYMEGWSHGSVFTDGWSKLVEDLLLETWSNLVFTMIGHKTFKLSVFHHETDNEIYFRKVEVVLWMILFMVMKDLIYRLLRITRRS